MDLRKLVLQNRKETVENLEHQIKLHAAATDSGDDLEPDGGIQLFGLPAGDDDEGPAGVQIQLASISLSDEEQFLDDIKSVDPDALDEASSIRLYSIIYATLRPGPSFRTGHQIWAPGLQTRVTPGGDTWQTYLDKLNPPVAGVPWSERVATIARQCVRLDQSNAAKSQAGSGFLIPDGRLLTARHVILYPGWFFGSQIPASLFDFPVTRPGKVFYNQVHPVSFAVNPPPEADINGRDCRYSSNPDLDFAAVTQQAGWQATVRGALPPGEYGIAAALDGLDLQIDPLTAEELKGRPVAVIGHPLSGNAGGKETDIPLVFKDAALGVKRFMPGMINSDSPLVGGRIKHDCSTLGGASGSCLIDLETGRVLGIHVAGRMELHNFAVPLWDIWETLNI